MEKAVLEGLLNLMAPIDEVSPWFRGLIYGETGTWKTIQACGVGARTPDKKLLYIESDPEGWVSLRNHPELMWHPNGNVRIQRMIYQGVTQLDAVCQAIEEDVPEFRDFDTIVLDTASNMAVLDLDNVVIARAKEDMTGKKSEDAPTQPDYNFNTERMRRRFMRIAKLPRHIVLVSHVREDKDEARGITYIRPNFTPKTRKTLEQMMHLIAFSTVIESEDADGRPVYKHKLQVHPTRLISAKSRIGGLTPVLEMPNLGNIVEEWLKTDEAKKPIEVTEEAEIVPESEGVDGPTLAETPVADTSPSLDDLGLGVT